MADDRKLNRVTFEYDDGLVEFITDNAQAWLEWMNGWIVGGQVRMGMIGENAFKPTWTWEKKMDGPIEAELPTVAENEAIKAALDMEDEIVAVRLRVEEIEAEQHQIASELDRHGAPPATSLHARIRGLVHAHVREVENLRALADMPRATALDVDRTIAAERDNYRSAVATITGERDVLRGEVAFLEQNRTALERELIAAKQQLAMPSVTTETPLTESQKARYERRMKTQYETIQSLQAQIAQLDPKHPSAPAIVEPPQPVIGFRKLPRERKSVTRKIPLPMVFEPCEFCGKAQPSTIVDLYATAGMYEDGLPGEVFMKVSKQGSMLSGLMDAFAVMMSLGLKQGVPVEKIVRKLSNMKFPPSGFTGQEDIPHVESPVDAVAKWLALRFLPKEPTP